jgi:hypothetical protein
MTRAVIDGKVGGKVEFWTGTMTSPVHITGNIIAWDPPRLFEHEWNVDRRPGFPKEERATIRWEIRPDVDTSILKLTHRHLTLRTAQDFAPGVHVFLDRLEAFFLKTPQPDWLSSVEKIRS